MGPVTGRNLTHIDFQWALRSSWPSIGSRCLNTVEDLDLVGFSEAPKQMKCPISIELI